jgi:SHAQKYF class myb-like DNA-binding protein
MFAVLSDKPHKIERFIIRVDNKLNKPKTEFCVTNPQKNKIKNSAKTFIENPITPIIIQRVPESESQATKASTIESTENKEIKRPKIRLSTIKVGPYQQNSNNGNGNNDVNMDKKHYKKSKEIKTKLKKINRDGNYNCGRWTPEEHQRFIEAIMKFGNEWKQVQKHVGSRSSTQARSHAQKFFVKIKKSNVLDFNLDLTKNSIKTLHELANTMNSDEYFNAIKALNCVAFERRNHIKRKNKKDDNQLNESSFMNGESQNTMYFK